MSSGLYGTGQRGHSHLYSGIYSRRCPRSKRQWCKVHTTKQGWVYWCIWQKDHIKLLSLYRYILGLNSSQHSCNRHYILLMREEHECCVCVFLSGFTMHQRHCKVDFTLKFQWRRRRLWAKRSDLSALRIKMKWKQNKKSSYSWLFSLSSYEGLPLSLFRSQCWVIGQLSKNDFKVIPRFCVLGVFKINFTWFLSRC